LKSITFAAKLIAVAMLIVGSVLFIDARNKRDKAKGESFVLTYRVTRVEPNKSPEVVGTVVYVENAKGDVKQTRCLDRGPGTPVQIQTRYVDEVAAYNLEGDHLEFIESTGESYQQSRQSAHSASLFTSSPTFVREDTFLGMKVYFLRQPIGDGVVETMYSPSLGLVPVWDRRTEGAVETIREAVSIQFRPVSDEEVATPALPIKFDRAIANQNIFLQGGDAAAVEMMNQAQHRMYGTRDKLRALGRSGE